MGEMWCTQGWTLLHSIYLTSFVSKVFVDCNIVLTIRSLAHSDSISCSDCGMRGPDCDADHVTLRLQHHDPQLWHYYSVLHSAIPNCDTVSLCYTPQSPTVTLSQARLRHVAVYGSSFQCEGSYLRVASAFQVGRSRSESKSKDF